MKRYLVWLQDKAGSQPYGTVIVRHGKIVAEAYGGGATSADKWEIGSIRKSVTSALLGMAIKEGRIALDTPVHRVWPAIANLTGAEKDKSIRVLHLATNTSGWMTKSGPEEHWLYNNAACTAGGMVIGRVYGLADDRIAPLVMNRIANPIGAIGWHAYHYDEQFSPGSHGRTGPKLAIDSNMRDLARYGYLWLRGGEWNGVQLIPRDYVRSALSNQVARLNAHYGYWWFTNDGRVLLPNAPEDTFYHIGNGKSGRRTVLLVIPSLDVVAAVGTAMDAFDISRDYTAQPVPLVNEWVREVMKALQ